MKKLQLSALVLGIATASLFSFKDVNTASIKGTVSPAEGATQAWALSSADTVKAPISEGAFEIKGLKAGTYQVVIEAVAPYKNTAKDGVEVAEGATVDVGEIKLNQ
ncbi:MAG TPA: carboxypeptidase-like regulatory domain-containing protein [Parasegetibacter sp.]|jgi:hypothetical protein